MPASQPQPMIEVAKPVMLVAAFMAQRRVGPVMVMAVAAIAKASAKVSSMATPRMFMGEGLLLQTYPRAAAPPRES